MNCKHGDLAVIVRSYAGNEGKVVSCLELIPAWEYQDVSGRMNAKPAWIVDIPLRQRLGLVQNIVLDEFLRPLRDGNGEDEMLRIAGQPNVGAKRPAVAGPLE